MKPSIHNANNYERLPQGKHTYPRRTELHGRSNTKERKIPAQGLRGGDIDMETMSEAGQKSKKEAGRETRREEIRAPGGDGNMGTHFC